MEGHQRVRHDPTKVFHVNIVLNQIAFMWAIQLAVGHKIKGCGESHVLTLPISSPDNAYE